MTLAEIHEILAYNRALIAETWNFFVTVHLALIGLVFLAHRAKSQLFLLILLVPAYASFMYINYRAQIDNYKYTKKILEYAEHIELSVDNNLATLSAIFDTGWIIEYLQQIYLLAFVFGVLIILSEVISQRKPFFQGKVKGIPKNS